MTVTGNGQKLSLFVCKRNIPIITVTTIIFTIILSLFADQYVTSYLVGLAAVVMGVTIGTYSVMLSRRYEKTEVLGSTFLFLAIAYFSYGAAEATWLYYDISGMDPYPSIADIMYTFYYIFAILYVAFTFFHFVRSVEKKDTLFVFVVIMSSILFYFVVSMLYGDIINSVDSDTVNQFQYGGMFVVMASMLIGISAITAHKFKNDLKILWIIIAVVMILNSATDVWYYTLENIDDYNYGNIGIDTAYFLADITLLFALHLHRKLI